MDRTFLEAIFLPITCLRGIWRSGQGTPAQVHILVLRVSFIFRRPLDLLLANFRAGFWWPCTGRDVCRFRTAPEDLRDIVNHFLFFENRFNIFFARELLLSSECSCSKTTLTYRIFLCIFKHFSAKQMARRKHKIV